VAITRIIDTTDQQDCEDAGLCPLARISPDLDAASGGNVEVLNDTSPALNVATCDYLLFATLGDSNNPASSQSPVISYEIAWTIDTFLIDVFVWSGSPSPKFGLTETESVIT